MATGNSKRIAEDILEDYRQGKITVNQAREEFGFGKTSSSDKIHENGLEEQERLIHSATYGFKEPAGDIHVETVRESSSNGKDWGPFDETLPHQRTRSTEFASGEAQVVVAPSTVPNPDVANQLRPVLIEAMINNEPGTDEFELASYIHDKLEEYLRDREENRDGVE